MTDRDLLQERFDESRDEAGVLRPAWEQLGKWLGDQTHNHLRVKGAEADSIF